MPTKTMEALVHGTGKCEVRCPESLFLKALFPASPSPLYSAQERKRSRPDTDDV